MTKLDFLMYVLDHLSIADGAEMEAICHVFDALDHDRDGSIHWHSARTRLRLQHVYSSVSTRDGATATAFDGSEFAPPPPRAAAGRGGGGGGARLAKNLMHPRTGAPPGGGGASDAWSPSAQAPLLPVQAPAPLPPHSAPYAHASAHACACAPPRKSSRH